MTGVAWVFMSVAFVVILGTAGLALKKIVADRVIRRRRVRSYPLSSSEDGQQSENRKSVYTLAHLQSSEKIWPEHTANAGRDSCKSARLFRYSGYFLPKCRLSQDKTFQSAEASPPEFYIRECPLSTEPVPGHDSSHNFRQSS